MIPNELKNYPNWVCWKGEPDPSRPGKLRKTPVNAKTGGNAMSNNPDTWSDYETALLASSNYSGLGFMFSNSPFFGVDIDDIADEIEAYQHGDSDNIVSEFIHALGSYAELSQSGNGIHIICKGELPTGGRRKANVECYENGRYFIMTGKTVSEYADVVDCSDRIIPLHAKYIGGTEPGLKPVTPVQPIEMSEQEVISKAMQSQHGQAFNMLYSGQWQGFYPSQSEADLAFCNMLAFWCGRDERMMDSIFRSSGLYRDKWDSKRGKSNYGQMVLSKAISDCREIYEPNGSELDDGYCIYVGEEKKNAKFYSWDDTGNAERFIDNFGEIVRYSYINKCWYWYDGKKWCQDVTGQVKKLIDENLKIMRLEIKNYTEDDEISAFEKFLKQSRSNKSKNNLLKESEHNVPILPHEFDSNIGLLNTQSGILNLKSGELMNHDKDKYFSRITHTDYSEKSDCPLWINFLNDIFDNDQELIRYIQKAIGYSLTGSTKEQCIFFLYGNGRNGKSTFIDTISAIMGDYAVNIQPETIMVKHSGGGANSDIARLKGARLVTTVEPNEGARLNEGLVKQLSGGDRITARFQYGSEFEYAAEFKIWMSTNHKPIIRGRDDGIWRRMHLIPFTVQIPSEKVDKNLKHKLKREYPGILEWAVQGCLLWQREGLKLPKAVSDATNEYKSEMDVVLAFLDECTHRAPGEARAGELYKAYREWAKENGQYEGMSNTKFGREVSQKYDKGQDKRGIYYKGLIINDRYKPYSISVG